MKVEKFEDFHKGSGLKHKWVAQHIGIMEDDDDGAGNVKWHRIRNGEADFPAKGRGKIIQQLSEIYGISPDKIMDFFDLGVRSPL